MFWLLPPPYLWTLFRCGHLYFHVLPVPRSGTGMLSLLVSSLWRLVAIINVRHSFRAVALRHSVTKIQSGETVYCNFVSLPFGIMEVEPLTQFKCPWLIQLFKLCLLFHHTVPSQEKLLHFSKVLSLPLLSQYTPESRQKYMELKVTWTYLDSWSRYWIHSLGKLHCIMIRCWLCSDVIGQVLQICS